MMVLVVYLSIFLICGIAQAFLFQNQARPFRFQVSETLKRKDTYLLLAESDAIGGVDDLSEERKATLFQYLLRDLQVEGIPLLGVDAEKVDTLQVAMWTTLAELCDQSNADKACMIFEDLAISDLKIFVDDFMSIKNETRLIEAFPELQRVSLSLVGKGVGPAILIDVAEVKPEDISKSEVGKPEPQLSAAIKAFMTRLGDKTDVYPYEKEAPTAYKLCRRNDVPHILSSFWNSVCELRATDEMNLGTNVVMLPGIDSHEQFTAISNLLTRSLCLFDGDKDFQLVHYFPDYDRNEIYPGDEASFGHIPPLKWIKSALEQQNDGQETEQLSDKDIAVFSNAQRQSPVPSVAIKRVSLIQPPKDSSVELELEDGRKVSIGNDIWSYAKNAKLLAVEGRDALKEGLAREKSFLV